MICTAVAQEIHRHRDDHLHLLQHLPFAFTFTHTQARRSARDRGYPLAVQPGAVAVQPAVAARVKPGNRRALRVLREGHPLARARAEPAR